MHDRYGYRFFIIPTGALGIRYYVYYINRSLTHIL